MVRASAAILVVRLVASAAAFAPPSVPSPLVKPVVNSNNARIDTALESTTADEDPLAEARSSYIETSRKFRRTRYTHDDWVIHRSPDRFFKNLKNIATSGIYRAITKEVVTVTGVASFVWAWNLFLSVGYTDLSGVQQEPLAHLPQLGLPLTAFTLASPSLGLLLVFRTNSAYRRWDEARKAWGLIINNSRNLARMGTAWINEPNEELRQRKLDKLAKCIWAFPRSLARHLESPFTDEAQYVADLREKLDPDHAEGLIQSAHRPNRALFDLATAVNNLSMHALRRNEIDKSIVVLGDQKGASERLFSSPVPLFYTRHTARYLAGWLLLLPFALWEPFAGTWNHIAMIPSAAVLSLFLFGIEELAIQLEEPFSILPLIGYANTIGQNAEEMITWRNIYDDPVKSQQDQIFSMEVRN